MLRELFNFERINWWTLLGGIGLNFGVTLFASMAGAYLSVSEGYGEMYRQYGGPLMMVAIFFLFGLTGFIVAKIADDVPLKHAFQASLGAVAPFLAGAVLFFAPEQLMLALIAVAGNLNGGMLAIPRSRRGPRP